MTNDPVALLARAVDQTASIIAEVRPDQTDLATPCRSWTVRQLIEHMMDDLEQFTTMAAGGSPDWSRPLSDGGEPAVGSWAGTFRAGGDSLVAAWRGAGELTGTTTLPGLGEVPARVPVDIQIGEFALHSWDLARATGQRAALDPELAEAALAFMRTALVPAYRGSEADGKWFGPEVPVAADAPVYDRLAAFAGRDPARR